MQAALLASRQAPTSPPKESGAQSSTPKGSIDLLIEEERITVQMSGLMTELVELQSRPEQTRVQKCRIQSIGSVIESLEIDGMKESAKEKPAHLSVTSPGGVFSIGDFPPCLANICSNADEGLLASPVSEGLAWLGSDLAESS